MIPSRNFIINQVDFNLYLLLCIEIPEIIDYDTLFCKACTRINMGSRKD